MQKSVCGCGFKCVFSVFQHFLGNKRSRFGLTKKTKVNILLSNSIFFRIFAV